MAFTPIAILGTGCVLPGAMSRDALWRLVREGRSALAPAPAGSWGLSPDADHAALAREIVSDVGGQVTGFDRVFSPDGFLVPLDPTLDPVFLWTLHAAREALREAGRDVFTTPVRGALVLGNLSYPTPGLVRYALDVWGNTPPSVDPRNRFMSGLPAALAARAIGFEGPAFALDAACASSLYAIALACDRLADGSVDLAIAGGVNHADDLFLHLGFTSLSALSPTGQSRPFHRDADGLVPAQGAAVVLLKRLADAARDGDPILGVIRGVGLSNDGRSRGLLVPSEHGQARAMRAAYDAAGFAPESVSLVECHATGTAVGDATEIRSLSTIFAGCRDVPIGSLKSNLGHLITAAGAAAVLKVIAAIRAGERPASLHADAPLDELSSSPLRVLHEAEPWSSPGPRRAAVSAFGFGGNNAHLLLEEWIPGAPTTAAVPAGPRSPSLEIAVVAMAVRAGSAPSAERVDAVRCAGVSLVEAGEARAPDFDLGLSGLRFPPADLLAAIPQQTWLLDTLLSIAEQGDVLDRLPRERTSFLAGMECDAEVARCGLRFRRSGAVSGARTDAPLTAAVTVGCMPNMVANRVNQQLGLSGPSFAISAEEASGTVALDLAVRALRAGEIDAAIVAAVDLSCEPVSRAAARAVLPAHRGAPADACVVLVLRRLPDARRDGDHVLAVLGDAPARADDSRLLSLDDRQSALAGALGHAHAASGLMHVAAAVMGSSRAGGSDPPTLVRVRATGGTETAIVVRAGDRDPPPARAATATPRGHRLHIEAHLPKVTLAADEPPAQRMDPPPRLPPSRGPRLAPTPAPSPAPPPAPPPREPAIAGDSRFAAAAILAAQHRDLAQMHGAFVRRQADLHMRFLDALFAPLTAVGLAPSIAPPIAAPLAPSLTPHLAPRLAAPLAPEPPIADEPPAAPPPPPAPAPLALPGPKLDRKALEALASGSISAVFGPLFREQDAFRRVVRMPQPPLLLADRVLGIAGEPGSMGLGTLWTETDITDDSWYLHEGRMPGGILIESGQADLLLISWLGVDAHNRGERVYRLLGCDLKSHGPLPGPGDTLSYEIHVDGHAAQGDVRLFFFHYDCRVNGELRVSVRGGQAGFFTDEELAASAGVLFRAEDAIPTPDPRLDPPVVVSEKRRFTAEDLDAFTAGRARACFGPGFERADTHTRTPTIQGGRMRLLDEVTDFDPSGGPWKRGYLRARLALSPDHWFFDGHFKDDPCMPGTLMFEGSLQTMTIYLAALGFTLDRDGFRFEPVPEQAYRLRCRGQAIPTSRELVYELFVDEIVGGANPTLFADLLGTVDGLKAFHCRRMGLRLVHGYPMDRGRLSLDLPVDPRPVARVGGFAFDHRSLLACAWGRPSEAFGPMYAQFDAGVRVPRLPGPPYHFMSRVASVSGAIGGMEKGSAVVAEYDVPEDAWYLADNGAPVMPFAVLLEVALQPCGWLASYAGCAISLEREVVFRNLDGTATIEREVGRDAGTLTTSARLTSISAAGGVLIVGFAVEVSCAAGVVFKGDTVFGFFPPETMRDQAGLPEPAGEAESGAAEPFDPETSAALLARGRLTMLGRVSGVWPEGGAAGLGRVVATRPVDAGDWYFRAHFMGDPVQPGSLGLEAMVQALEALTIAKGLTRAFSHPRLEALAAGVPVTWKYRGQVVPENHETSVEVEITEVVREPRSIVVVAQGSLRVDGKRIYHARGLAIRITGELGEARPPVTSSGGDSSARLFPIFGSSREELRQGHLRLAEEASRTPFAELSRSWLSRGSGGPSLAYVITARDEAELGQEIARAEGGISRAFDQGEVWRTPAGSYFTARPVGPDAKIAFVYPGMGSAYLGAGAGLMRRFPWLLRELAALPGLEAGQSIARDLADLESGQSPGDQRADLALAFARDATRVSSASMALSYAMTRLLRRDLGLIPGAALGFSIGEGSMFTALAWPDPAILEARLSRSAVFRERLAGPMLAVRERFGLSPDAPFEWGAVIVKVSADDALRALRDEPRAHLLTIHTPAEVMLGGDLESCRRVVAALGAPATFVPFQLAMHCDASLSEEAEISALHTLPVIADPTLTFYSAADCAPVLQTSAAIADRLARSYTRTVDFPALVRRVHDDGARVFIEVGAQSNCSHWISHILAGRPHAAVPLASRAFDDETSLARALAVLISHRVRLDPTPLLDGDSRAPDLIHADLGSMAARLPRSEPDPISRAWMSVLAGEIASLLSLSDATHLPEEAPLSLDSLAALELRARLERRLGVAISAEVLFRRHTLRSLGDALAALGPPLDRPAEGRVLIEVPSAPPSLRYRGCWSQEEMWHMKRTISSRLPPAELHRTTPILWIRSRMAVHGPLDPTELSAAIRATFANHDILRSVVKDAGDDGPPIVEVLADWLPEVPVHDLEGLPAEEQSARIQDLFTAPLDPSLGPPARVVIFRTAALDHTICLHQHHLFTDGLSLVRFWQEVLERYRAGSAGVPPDLPALGPSFAEYCAAQHAWLASPDSAADRDYWARTLDGATPLLLPYDAPRADPTDFRGGRVDFTVPADLCRRVGAAISREDAGMFAALLLALGETLRRATGQEDLLFTTYHANRVLPGLPGSFEVMGPLTAGLALRLLLRPGDTLSANLRRAHRTVMEALVHGALPFSLMRLPDGSLAPPPRVSLMYQAFVPPDHLTIGPLTVRSPEPVGFGAGQASFELELVIWPEGEGLRGVAAFATQVFRRPTVERLVAEVLGVLEELSSNRGDAASA